MNRLERFGNRNANEEAAEIIRALELEEIPFDFNGLWTQKVSIALSEVLKGGKTVSRNVLWTAIFVLMFLMVLGTGKHAIAGEKIVIGWLEKVYLPQYDLVVRAKIDTGAKNSSIDARDIEYIKGGEAEGSRIRFKTMYSKDKYRIIEAMVLREVRIKESASITRTRPEIEMQICLGGVRKRIRVNLKERRGMHYRMILGRTALEGDFIVDVTKKFIAGRGCRE